jgi:hypothetical protein
VPKPFGHVKVKSPQGLFLEKGERSSCWRMLRLTPNLTDFDKIMRTNNNWATWFIEKEPPLILVPTNNWGRLHTRVQDQKNSKVKQLYWARVRYWTHKRVYTIVVSGSKVWKTWMTFIYAFAKPDFEFECERKLHEGTYVDLDFLGPGP